MQSGDFASNAPRASCSAGAGAFVVGADGITPGYFGWVDRATGIATNRLADAAVPALGIVQTPSFPNVLYWHEASGTWRFHSGYPVVLYNTGDFYMLFANGAYPHDLVYADATFGFAVAAAPGVAQPSNTVLTPWVVCAPVAPGGLGQITSYP